MPGLDPGTHQIFEGMDCLVKPGNDGQEAFIPSNYQEHKKWLPRT